MTGVLIMACDGSAPSASEESMHWALENFAQADLGDRRLSKDW
jgi:hypothetical protein